MRKSLCLTLAALMLVSLLAGCAEVPVPMGPNTDPTEPDGNETTVPTVTISGIPEVENPGSSLIEYDPDREYYLHTGNIDTTHYCEGNTFQYRFHVYSKHEIDPDQVRVRIPCQNEYSFEVRKLDLFMRDTEYNQGENETAVDNAMFLPYYVYMNYWDIDYELAAYYYNLMIDPPEEGTEEAEEAEEKTGGRDPWVCYQEIIDAALPAYQALKPEDVREFYIYTVYIEFAGDVEETITEMDVTIEGETIHQELGALHLDPGSVTLQYSYADGHGIQTNAAFLQTGGQSLFAESGLAYLNLFDMYAEKDVTLEELHFFNEETEFLEINLNVTSSDGKTITTQWDGKSSYDLYAGDHFVITAVIRNPNLLGLYYYVELNYEMIVTIEEEKLSHHNCLTISPMFHNHHELYAIVFDGVDMEPYYRENYYALFQTWRAPYEG